MEKDNENFKITEFMINNNEEIAEEYMPKRIVIATDVYFIKEDKNGTKNLLLFNYYNNYAPYFCSHNIEKDFKSKTFKELQEEFQQGLEENKFQEEYRIIDTKKDLYEKMKIENIEIYKEKELLPDEYWIKYSVSKNVWSMYLIEHFLVKDLKTEMDIQQIDLNDAIWLPISNENIQEIIKTGKYKNLKIIDTLVELLKDTNIIKKLFY